MIKYNLVKADETANITVVVDGEMHVASSNHPQFNEIVRRAVADDDTVVDLFNATAAVQRKFAAITERVTFDGGSLYFDGDLIDDSAATLAVRFMREGHDFGAVVAFIENVQQNPQEHSREQAWDWLSRRDFTITDEGMVVAYKGVRNEGSAYASISRGTAVSDGVEHTGQIPQDVGSVVEMPRSKVQHDPSVGCHTGLHVGTWEYAEWFAQGAVLEVLVNPRDIVSVPTDCDWQKMRVCRYTVDSATELAQQSALQGASTVDYDYNYEDAFEDEGGEWDDFDF